MKLLLSTKRSIIAFIIAILFFSGHLSGKNNVLKNTAVDLNFRYRIETVDMSSMQKDAIASTLRTRATISTKWSEEVDSVIEFDDVSVIGPDHYNPYPGAISQYPVIADPVGTEVNQAYIRYSTESTKVAFGRQRILLGNQRLIGGVGWRQNEQTFDSLTTRSSLNKNFKFDYSYIFNVNRVFGENVAIGDHKHNTHLLSSDYKINTSKLSGYYLAIDNETVPVFSNNTLGFRYENSLNKFSYALEFATQSDAGDNLNDYSASYRLLQGQYNTDNYFFGASYEVLGGDATGGQGFTTSLATGHKFQGWADLFLATPIEGIEDVNVSVSTKLKGINAKVIYHNLKTDQNSQKLGSEIDLLLTKKINENFSGLIKIASFNSSSAKPSVDKIFFMVNYKL
jgi:hypothetical protein